MCGNARDDMSMGVPNAQQYAGFGNARDNMSRVDRMHSNTPDPAMLGIICFGLCRMHSNTPDRNNIRHTPL